jgi:murein L,D-transpeptidase YafK
MQTENHPRRGYWNWDVWQFHGLIMMLLKQGLVSLLVMVGLLAPGVSWATERKPWIEVDTRALTLTVFSAGNHVLARFDNISIGSGGVSEIHRQGDETTPLGVFHVAWIDRHSRFGTFYGLDYPSETIARRAYAEGSISQVQLDAIVKALKHHRVPPQNTPLGGRLGIHGIGSGDPVIQKTINWTDGCVALTNQQIRQLSRWVRVGTRVVIR